jgi:hypothetical protein
MDSPVTWEREECGFPSQDEHDRDLTEDEAASDGYDVRVSL